MTRSHGASGLIFFGSPPIRLIASRIAARSTTAGTPVRSCVNTRAGMKAISFSFFAFGFQPASVSTSAFVTRRLSSCRKRFSKRIFNDTGSCETVLNPAFSSRSNR